MGSAADAPVASRDGRGAPGTPIAGALPEMSAATPENT